MKIALLLALSFLVPLSANAQKTHSPVEVFGGYSFLKTTGAIFRARNIANGWNAGVTGNFTRYLGIEGRLAGHYGNYGPVIPFDDSYYLFQAGPRFTYRLERLTPWGHALFGVSQSRVDGAGAIKTSFAGTFGGGLDVIIHKRVALRVFQADYVRMRINSISAGGVGSLIIVPTPSNNLSFSFGVVLKLGGGQMGS